MSLSTGGGPHGGLSPFSSRQNDIKSKESRSIMNKRRKNPQDLLAIINSSD